MLLPTIVTFRQFTLFILSFILENMILPDSDKLGQPKFSRKNLDDKLSYVFLKGENGPSQMSCWSKISTLMTVSVLFSI